MGESFQDYSWIQNFEADFPQKVIHGFFDLISVYIKTIDHLSLKLLIFIGILQVLRWVDNNESDFSELLKLFWLAIYSIMVLGYLLDTNEILYECNISILSANNKVEGRSFWTIHIGLVNNLSKMFCNNEILICWSIFNL